MRTLLSTAGAVLMAATMASGQAATGSASSTGGSGDEAAIRKLADQYASAWNAGNARQAASLFAEDGAFTVITGETLKGRTAIEKMLTDDPQGIGTARTGQTLSIDTESVRFLEPGVAVTTGHTQLKGGRVPPGEGGGHYMAVARRVGSEWKIVAVHTAVEARLMEPAVETASRTTGTSGSSSAADEQAVEALEREWLNALEKADTATLDRILTDDFIEVGPGGGANDKAASLAETKKGDMVFESIALNDAKTRIFGDTALLVGTGAVKAKYKGQDVSGTYRWTDAFVKRNGRWQAVSGHVTKVMPEQ